MEVRILVKGRYMDPVIIQGKVNVLDYAVGDTEDRWSPNYSRFLVDQGLAEFVDDGTDESVEVKEAKPVEVIHSEINAAPSTIEFANEHDIDLSQVKGTGSGGRILKGDVEAALQSRAQVKSNATELDASKPEGWPKG